MHFLCRCEAGDDFGMLSFSVRRLDGRPGKAFRVVHLTCCRPPVATCREGSAPWRGVLLLETRTGSAHLPPGTVHRALGS